MEVQSLSPDLRSWANALVAQHFGSTSVVSRDVLHDVSLLPALVAISGGQPLGVLHYRLDDDECEIVSLVAATSGLGAGSSLVKAICGLAAESGCERLWLVTTNDNSAAQDFYRARGFSRISIYPGAVAAARLLKPEIPLVGQNGIPIEDEIEYELALRT
ncbi:MAG: GNAT family N-acetyltransferase [Actinomycetota bacterium]|nr:GNAT family N-acetyltransferase [Actinomycetota bacterium]